MTDYRGIHGQRVSEVGEFAAIGTTDAAVVGIHENERAGLNFGDFRNFGINVVGARSTDAQDTDVESSFFNRTSGIHCALKRKQLDLAPILESHNVLIAAAVC